MTSKLSKRHVIHLQLQATKFAALQSSRELWNPTDDASAPTLRVKLDRAALRARLRYVLDLVCDSSACLSVAFCDSPTMAAANRQFRRRTYPTDVLSFPSSDAFTDPERATEVDLGEILVCVPVCVAQAARARQTPSREFEKMLVHGIVHLKGFDHERGDAAFRVMEALEKGLMRELERNFGAPQWAEVNRRGS